MTDKQKLEFEKTFAKHCEKLGISKLCRENKKAEQLDSLMFICEDFIATLDEQSEEKLKEFNVEEYYCTNDDLLKTNQEKAKYIANGSKFQSNHFHDQISVEYGAFQMADWKDEQYAWQKIPKDKDGFYDDLKKNLYDELPIIVMNKYDDGLYPSFEYICKDNWCDAVSDLSKPSYQYYMKIQEIPTNQ